MPTDVLMPQMGESITEGTLTKWLKKLGDTVVRDEPLFEISTDKVDAEIPSPVAGTLDNIKVSEGATVVVNTVVCTVSEGNSSAKSLTSAEPETATQERDAEETVTPSAEATSIRDTATSNGASASFASDPNPRLGTEVLMPQMGESITEGTLTRWLKKVGDNVQRDEPIFEISTDKVDAEIPSPTAGTLSEIKVAEGSTVTINAVVGVIVDSAALTPKPAILNRSRSVSGPISRSNHSGRGACRRCGHPRDVYSSPVRPSHHATRQGGPCFHSRTG